MFCARKTTCYAAGGVYVQYQEEMEREAVLRLSQLTSADDEQIIHNALTAQGGVVAVKVNCVCVCVCVLACVCL